MDTQILQLINVQINFEFFSSYLYLGFANYYAEADLDGFENWFRIQAQEELDHAMLLIQMCIRDRIYALFMSVFNDMRVSHSELLNLGYLLILILIIWGVLYLVYRRALHKSQQILGIL